jgi:hypothetical protein
LVIVFHLPWLSKSISKISLGSFITEAAELINAETRFDAEKYVNMLILAGANILGPFGYAEEALKHQIVYGQKQTALKPVLTTTSFSR